MEGCSGRKKKGGEKKISTGGFYVRGLPGHCTSEWEIRFRGEVLLTDSEGRLSCGPNTSPANVFLRPAASRQFSSDLEDALDPTEVSGFSDH